MLTHSACMYELFFRFIIDLTEAPDNNPYHPWLSCFNQHDHRYRKWGMADLNTVSTVFTVTN